MAGNLKKGKAASMKGSKPKGMTKKKVTDDKMGGGVKFDQPGRSIPKGLKGPK